MSSITERTRGVRSLERGLAMLELVNEAGAIRPADAARQLRLPRPTSHRLLETLEELGYVRRSPTDSRFSITQKALRLSSGYNQDRVLSEVVGPVLSRLLSELIWPVNISTYHAGVMVVRETTHERSPFSIDGGMLGREVPILRTACGRAYLSFCPERQREAIVEQLRLRAEPEDAPFLQSAAIEQLVRTCRKDGFASRLGESYVPRTSSIAMPLIAGEAVQACLSIVWLTSAIRPKRAVEQFAPPLRAAAREIATRMEAANLDPARPAH